MVSVCTNWAMSVCAGVVSVSCVSRRMGCWSLGSVQWSRCRYWGGGSRRGLGDGSAARYLST